MLVRSTNLSQKSLEYPLDWGQGPRGFWAGGGDEYEGGGRGDITYVNISTLGNSMHVGDPLSDLRYCGGVGGRGRGIIAGGSQNTTATTAIHYVTVSVLGNSTSFGVLTGNRRFPQTASNGERALIVGGYEAPEGIATMDYVEIAIPGNATNFGNLSSGPTIIGDSTGNGVYGMFWVDASPDKYDYVAIDTPGNTTVFGSDSWSEMSQANSNGARAFWSGGYDGGDLTRIDYLTWSTPSTGTQYGTLRVYIYNGKGVEDGSRAVVGGGYISGNTPASEYFDMDLAAGSAVISASFGTHNGSDSHRMYCASFAG
jgi:hypothetical protein